MFCKCLNNLVSWYRKFTTVSTWVIQHIPRKTTCILKKWSLIPLNTLHWQTLRAGKKHVYQRHQSKLLCLFFATYSHLSQSGKNMTTLKYKKKLLFLTFIIVTLLDDPVQSSANIAQWSGLIDILYNSYMSPVVKT